VPQDAQMAEFRHIGIRATKVLTGKQTYNILFKKKKETKMMDFPYLHGTIR